MVKWAFRGRSGVYLIEAEYAMSWHKLHHLARLMRKGYCTYCWHNDRWVPVL